MNKSGNTFTCTYELAAGTHEYKFVVDGNWISDPSNPILTGSDHNSYVVVSGGSVSGPTTSNTVRIHFQNTLGWETVCASAWTTGAADPAMGSWSWPGQVLPLDDDGNYLLEVTPNLASGQSLGFLFHDFDKNQTVDLSVDYATVSKGNAELWVKPTTVNEEDKYFCTTSTTSTASPRVEGSKVTFTYTGTASSVSVAGSFNSWNMAKMTKSGSTFTYSTTLAAGIYEYKLIVDNKWITDPSNGAAIGDNSLLMVGDNTANSADDKITVQFHIKKSGSYTGWDGWVWDDFTGGSAYTLKTGTLSDKLVSVTVDSASTYVGFILRKSDWSNQSDTYYADLKNISSGTVHCFVDFDGASMTQVRDRDVKLCGSANYAEMDYESNTFWIKTTAPVEAGMVSVVRADGSASDVSVTGFSFNDENFGYTLNLSRLVTLDDLIDLRIRVNGTDCKIEPNGYIFYSDRFHADYTYNGNDLGATWTKNGTTFKAWAPTAWDVKLIRYSAGNGNFDDQGYDKTWIEEIDMVRGDKGVWSLTVPGDLHGTYYNYKVTFANRTHEAVDPYAKSTGIDGYRSMVLNMAATNPEGWDNDVSPNQGMSYTDAIIYEMHIREYTVHSTSGVKEEWRGKYLGMTQEGTSYQGHATGLDHQKQLGVTHVQIMPFNDFEASISETDAVNMGEDLYGWGYNPKNFNTPEGSYATDPFNGEVRVNELKQMIQALHSSGINVIMDSVYNHVYDGGGFSYAKLTDGSYVYSKLAPYSPMTYATSQLKNSTDVKLKQLAVAMLNYGAEAQLFFGHNTGNLANAALNAEHLALPESYRADMVSAVPAASAAKQGTFANNSGFSSRYPAISFEGAFCINYFFTPKYAPKDGITLYYWNAADYNAVSVLTAANATGSIKLEGSGTGEYRGDITGISAKNLSEAVYVAAVYQNGSTTWTSGVLGYSIGTYCSSQASKNVAISALAKATAVYGYHAKQYFG